ncbi:fibroleukin-like [Saccostrea cucullata]|uniref:fibroleukin-like n=1 Tax=Saccostrea cuccullata TaxID=36930 RepID=UPI002ED46CEF
MCQRECVLFGFNSQMKKCRTHKKLFTSELSEEVSWKYYSDSDFVAVPKDCKDLREDNQTSTGVYDIYPYGTLIIPVRVYCDMTTMGGGWTAIQKRVDGSVSFDRTWREYKNDFGSPEQEVWVGNDVIHLLTKGKNSSLFVSITLEDEETFYEMYDRFSVSDETEKYQLFLAGPATGTLEYNLQKTLCLTLVTPITTICLGMFFSTPDRDNDGSSDRNCAAYS